MPTNMLFFDLLPICFFAIFFGDNDLRILELDSFFMLSDFLALVFTYSYQNQKKGWSLASVVNAKPAVTDYGEIHEIIINSIQMGNIGESIVLNVTMINHTPDVEKNFHLTVTTPHSFNVDKSQSYYFSKGGNAYSRFPDRPVYFSIDDSPGEFNFENLTFNSTKIGTFKMSIKNSDSLDDIWFVIDESNSYWSYDKPIRPEASSKISSLSEGPESGETAIRTAY